MSQQSPKEVPLPTLRQILEDPLSLSIGEWSVIILLGTATAFVVVMAIIGLRWVLHEQGKYLRKNP